jgi:calcium binding protein 39
LLANFDEFFREYEDILCSGSYVVQRQALTLLSELLLERSCMNVMIKYVCSDRYLRTIMNLLRSHSRTLQFEAFQLFKLFAANPNQPIRVRKILTKNQLGLIELIDNMQPKTSSDDQDNSQFFKDKKKVIDKLQALAPEPEPLCLAKVKITVDDKPASRNYSKSNVSTSASTACTTAWTAAPSTVPTTYTDVDNWAAEH